MDSVDTHAISYLAGTKIHRPSFPADYIVRPNLVQRLENGCCRPLTLVCAPAGYGKSTLVSSWLTMSERPSAWLSLDAGDNDPHIFIGYMLAAVQALFPGFGQSTRAMLAGSELPPIPLLARNLVNELGRVGKNFILVLDDVHRVHERSVHDLLTEFLEHPPAPLHLVIISRFDPFLPISALRARGQVTEIRMHDLRFSCAETTAYLQQIFPTGIDEKNAQLWTDKTEGWITGLRLAALSIKHRNECNPLLPELCGSTQYVMQYLFNEALENHSPEIRKYLVSLSVVAYFCAPLCDVLCTSEDSGGENVGWDIIALLQKENLFVFSLDAENRWFRYHHLFRQLLKNQLKRYCTDEEIAGLHALASRWFADNNCIEEAIEHALLAGESQRAGCIIEDNRMAALHSDQWYILEKWLDMLPDRVLQKRPALLLAQAWVYYYQLRYFSILDVVEKAETLLAQSGNNEGLRGEVDFFRGCCLYFQNKGERSLLYIQSALTRIPHTHYLARSEAEILCALGYQMQGNSQTALEMMQALLYFQKTPRKIRKTRLLAAIIYVRLLSGELDGCSVKIRELLDVSSANNDAYAQSWGWYLAGLVAWHQNRTASAVRHLKKAVDARYVLHTRAAVDAMAGLVYAYEFQNKSSKADEILALLFEYVVLRSDPGYCAIAHSCKARLQIMRGRCPVWDCPREERRRFEGENSVWWLEVPGLTYCRALIARDKHNDVRDAVKRLERYRTQSRNRHNVYQCISISCMLVVAYHKQHRDDKAFELLEQTVSQAFPGGWCHTFVECGPVMTELLMQLRRRSGIGQDIDRLLEEIRKTVHTEANTQITACVPGSDAPVSLDQLTNRETDILKLLEGRMSNKEIADSLFVSPETVKTHLKNIFQKLHVSNRRQAVIRATCLGILPRPSPR